MAAIVRCAMTQQKNPSPGAGQQPDSPKGDPWHAFGYILSGVVLYGILGWVLDQWLGTTFLVAIGILLGAGFGLYMTWSRFKQPSAN